MQTKTIAAGYKQTDVGLIPEDWNVERIESIISEISMGPFGSDIKVSNFISEGVPVLSGANVASERLKDSFTNFVSPTKAKSLKRAVAHRGDIVVTHRGTLGQIAFIPENSKFENYVVSQSQFRAHFHDDVVIPEWVVLYFHSEQGAAKLLEGKGHTGVPAIAQPTKTFRNLSIPLPSLPEQTVIISTLSNAETLVEKTEDLLFKKRAIRRGAMQVLLTGKRRLPGFSGKWQKGQLGNVIERLVGGGTPSRRNPSFWGDEIPWVTVKDFATFHPRVTQESITKKGLQQSASHLIPAGTLITSTRMALGKTVVYEVDVAINQDLKALFLRPNVDMKFVYYWFELNAKKIDEMGSGSTVKGISISDLKAIPLLIAPLPEQQMIASVLSDMDKEIEELEKQLEKLKALKQGMMQVLLTGKIRLPTT